ncbi:hypothetical protein D6D19_10061 [Aureobasidium pullulans]|uniref:Trichothecene 3-O-acetyltransferase n=1 Tax=Aureobasidium pullulans TaxID=5580 RepID=A0A4S9KBU5_AURPU|nr:hypothetical protein D6D19_10061 [Aureobasidium pullulans]THY12694.1 hypothetical protein D6D00_10403 [Aureobasidium pullulans]
MEAISPYADTGFGVPEGTPKMASTIAPESVDIVELGSPSRHTLDLSLLEQANPRSYTRPLFFFATPQGVRQEEVVEIFRKALKPSLKAMPSLACEIVPVVNGTTLTEKKALKHGDFGSLIVNDLRGIHVSYEELRKQNFPQSRLEPDILCARGVFPKPGEKQPCFIPQLNTIDGGFILAFNTHHTTYDAQAINEILRLWAQNCRHVQNQAIMQCNVLPAEQFERSAHTITGEPTADMGRPEHHPDLIAAPVGLTWPEAALKDTHRQRVYRLSPEALAELKTDCSEPGKSWISTNDAVTALIWRSVIRAQADIDTLPNNTMSHHVVIVDLRLRSDPPLSKHYPGCPMNYVRPGMNLRELCSSTSLAILARAIRNEVEKRTPEYTKSLITLLDNYPCYGHVAWKSFPSLLTSDCMTSTWNKLDLLDLDWGPALGRIERVRYPKGGLFNGLSMIYPQITRGEQDELGMEIAIGMETQHFEKLNNDMTWRKYAEPTDPGYDCL